MALLASSAAALARLRIVLQRDGLDFRTDDDAHRLVEAALAALALHIADQIEHGRTGTMFGLVEADGLGIGRHTQGHCQIDQPQQDIGDAEAINRRRRTPEQLDAELGKPVMGFWPAGRVAEDGHRQRAPDAGKQMHRHGTHRIVDFPAFQQFGAEQRHGTADRADDQCGKP